MRCQVDLRNKFHFSEVHGSMNVTGPVQSHVNFAREPFGRHVNFARDPLRSYFHEPQKNEIHLLYLHFVFKFIVFVHYLWNFGLNLGNKGRRKVITRRVWLLPSTAVTMT